MESFGYMLRIFRQRSFDPIYVDHRLTQERLGELLGAELGIAGYSGAAISDWEREKSFLSANDRLILVALLRILFASGGVTNVTEANSLLEAGNYRSLDGNEIHSVFYKPLVIDHKNQSFQQQIDPRKNQDLAKAIKPLPLWPPGIPDEPYYPLPGQENILNKAYNLLKEKQNYKVVSIDGLGGNGKTAIAAELSRRLLQSGFFQGIIGETAKQEIFVNGEIVFLESASLDYERFLDALARQLHLWEIFALDIKGKESALAHILRNHHYLVLIDNLETAHNANALIARFISLLGSSYAILTSRPKVKGGAIYSITVSGLDSHDSLFFLRSEATRIESIQILNASDRVLYDIHEITGGSPLAMKLVAAQAKFLDLERVLSQLRKARGDIFPFIFRQSWDQLSVTAQNILIYIGKTVFETIGAYELEIVELLPKNNDLIDAIEQLCSYSLLNIYYESGQVRYGIHQLTRQFVVSDLPKIWREQGLL